MTRHALLLSASFLAIPAALGASEPVLMWPGSRQPLREEAVFLGDDYPGIRGLVRQVRASRQMLNYGLSGMTLSLWMRVPLRPGTHYPVARFNAMPGSGANRHHTLLLEVSALPEGGHALTLRKYGEDAFSADPNARVRAPYPANLANQWVHVVLAVPRFSGNRNPSSQEVTLYVNGTPTQGRVYNGLRLSALGALCLGGEGVGVCNVLCLDEPIEGAQAIQALAKRTVPTATRPLAQPEPPIVWGFDFSGSDTSWLHGYRALTLEPGEAGENDLPAPNGKATSRAYYTASHGFWFPSASGESWTLMVLARAAKLPGRTILCQGISTAPSRDQIVLATAPRGVSLTLSSTSRTCPPIEAPSLDAAAGFRLYAIRFHHGSLSLWVDGRRVGEAKVSACSTAADANAPYIVQPNRLTLTDFQVGKRFGERGTIADPAGFAVDEVAFYGRALTAQEIRGVTAARNPTARPPTAAPAAPRPGRPTPQPAAREAAPEPAAQPTPAALAQALAALPRAAFPPSEDDIADNEALLEEIVGEGEADGDTFVGFLKDATSDAARLVLLRAAEKAYAQEGRLADALAVLRARDAAFPGEVADGDLATLAAQSLRANAADAPDKAIGEVSALLRLARESGRAEAVAAILRQARIFERHLSAGKRYPRWQRLVADIAAERRASAELDTLRDEAKGGDPAANRALAFALAQEGRWDAETLAAFVACGERGLVAAARLERVNPNAKGEPAIVQGNAWWGQAAALAESDPEAAALLRAHAVELYERGVDALSGLRARLIKKRIDSAR